MQRSPKRAGRGARPGGRRPARSAPPAGPRLAALLLGGLLVAGCSSVGSAPAGSTTQPATSVAASGPAAGPPPPAGDRWTTYHADPLRTGAVPAPPAGAVREAWRTGVGGQVYAEPLVDAGRVVVATEQDTVYALNAATGAVDWSTRLGTPLPGSALPCGNIDPSGITGTPVLDPSAGVVWAVAFVEPGRHELVGLRLTTGAVVARRPITLPGVDPLAEQQRGALSLDTGRVVVPFGGLYGDCGHYRGFVVSFPVGGSGAQRTFAVPASREGAIWGPPGAVVLPDGDLLVATGNSAPATTYDEGDSVLRLDPALRVVDSFAPADWARLNADDLDLGSTSPAVVGAHVVQTGKSGLAYLLAVDHLGGIGGQLARLSLCAAGAYGGTAVAGDLLYVPCRDGLRAVRVGPGPALRLEWDARSVVVGAPVVAGGRVWGVSTSGDLVELDPATGTVVAALPIGQGSTDFPSLAIAGSWIYAQAGAAIEAVRGA